MTYLSTFLSALVFGVALRLVSLPATLRRADAVARRAVAIMRDASVDDAVREYEVRRASGALMGSFLSITLRAAFALVMGAAPLFVADVAGWSRWRDATALLASWPGLAIGLVAMALATALPLRP